MKRFAVEIAMAVVVGGLIALMAWLAAMDLMVTVG